MPPWRFDGEEPEAVQVYLRPLFLTHVYVQVTANGVRSVAFQLGIAVRDPEQLGPGRLNLLGRCFAGSRSLRSLRFFGGRRGRLLHSLALNQGCRIVDGAVLVVKVVVLVFELRHEGPVVDFVTRVAEDVVDEPLGVPHADALLHQPLETLDGGLLGEEQSLDAVVSGNHPAHFSAVQGHRVQESKSRDLSQALCHLLILRKRANVAVNRLPDAALVALLEDLEEEVVNVGAHQDADAAGVRVKEQPEAVQRDVLLRSAPGGSSAEQNLLDVTHDVTTCIGIRVVLGDAAENGGVRLRGDRGHPGGAASSSGGRRDSRSGGDCAGRGAGDGAARGRPRGGEGGAPPRALPPTRNHRLPVVVGAIARGGGSGQQVRRRVALACGGEVEG
ncbi:uncharacterized protein BcabD6B2_14540 [Babesia caballi]|uniref:Uncharacterized protein n=1 Tax=Babesia caballi TaxID=5871 RepID=A0AAV4LQ14_BABCB|nr:hypothetical protein BcabD6B2_14540 [Babesia caballi]